MDVEQDVTKKQDQEVFDFIFTKFYKFVFVKAFFIIQDKEAAEDLVQSFFIDLWENKHYLMLEDDMKGYLYRSIRNRALNYLRDTEKKLKRQEHYLINRGDSFEKIEEPNEQICHLKQALNELPNQQQRALRIVYMQARKYQEAADLMGISINSLKSHLKTGLKNLRIRIK